MRTLVLLLLCACNGQTLYRTAISWERFRAGVSLHEVTVDGHNVPYLEGGTGETVVLVHGFGADKDTWLRFAKALNDGFHVVAIDVPGFGDSSRVQSASYDVVSQAKRLDAVLEALHIDHPHLVGNSMGGAISLQYVLGYPGRAKSLTLMDSAGVRTKEPSEVGKMIAQGRNPLIVASVADLDRLMGLNFVIIPTIPDSIKAFFVQRATNNRAFTEKIFSDLNALHMDYASELPKVAVKTLVMWGDEDRIIHPSAARIFADGIPNAKLVVLDKCGHSPAFERPDEAATLWKAFVN